MKIVLDTNVLISGLLNPSGSPSRVLNLILNGKLKLLIDNRIFLEYSDVIRRPKFKFKIEWINPLLDFIKMESDFILAEPFEIDFSDPDDLVFYEVAKSGEANYLITGNKKHFPEESNIVTPKEFIDLIYHEGEN